MDRHAVPKQVTTFEFKLIGWFTVKEFIYLILFTGFAVITYFLIRVPYLNIVMASLVALLGVALVFYKYNERPLDVWIKNLIVSIMQPSQFLYMKDNPVPDFLKGVYITIDQGTAQTFVDANQKLSNYMQQTGQQVQGDQNKQDINTLIHSTPAHAPAGQQSQQPTPQQAAATPVVTDDGVVQPSTPNSPEPTPATPHPFMSGIIRNSKEEPLQNIMVYVNSDSGQVVRILKTNHNGIFATFHPLPSGTYILSPKDLSGNFFFDTMNVTVEGPLKEPLQIFSKELL